MADISVIRVNNADYTVKDTTARNHIAATDNPHGVTAAQVGLGNVDNKSSATIRSEITSSNVTSALGFTPVSTTAVGAASGVAPLGVDSKVPASYLPSFVDDVIDGYLYNGKFYKEAAHTTELTAESDKIYIDLTDNANRTYRWSGSVYAEVSPTTVYSGSNGITVNGTTISHSNSVTAGSATPEVDSTDKYKLDLPNISYDAQGHITGVETVNFGLKPSTSATTFSNSHDVDITPAGSVSKPSITVTPTSASTLTAVATAGTVPSWSAEVSEETLSFSFSAGAMPTFSSADRMTGATAALDASPTFTGTAKYLTVEIADETPEPETEE